MIDNTFKGTMSMLTWFKKCEQTNALGASFVRVKHVTAAA